jgi:hypothetical protein
LVVKVRTAPGDGGFRVAVIEVMLQLPDPTPSNVGGLIIKKKEVVVVLPGVA